MMLQNMFCSGYDGVLFFTASLSISVTIRLIKRDFFLKAISSSSSCSQLRHHSKGLPFPHQLMSHRGGSSEHVENTMPAFRHSAKLQVDLLELDVQLTKDGHVVICHDDNLLRLCGRNVRIRDLAYAELPPLLIPSSLSSVASVVGDTSSTQIPLLLTLLDEFPLYPMQIDVKNGSEVLVKLVGSYIKKYDRAEFTVWGSFIPRANQLCYDLFGTEIPLFFCARRAWLAYALHSIGCLSFLPFRETALIIPNILPFRSHGFLREMNCRGVSVLMFGMGSGALNSPKEWQAVKDLGANGICSDAPTALKAWLVNSHLRPVLPNDGISSSSL